MSGSVNKQILIGHVAADPEVRFSQSGAAICNFRIITNEYWNNAAGEKQERATGHRIVAFGKLATMCGEYVRKGRQLYLEGRTQERQYEVEGVKHYVHEVVAQSIQFLGTKPVVAETATPSANPADVTPDYDGFINQEVPELEDETAPF